MYENLRLPNCVAMMTVHNEKVKKGAISIHI
jgi:hypothetical protein